MMPSGSLKNTIVELGIESIMLRRDKKDKKFGDAFEGCGKNIIF
jgi:hypothetical protein